MYPAEVDTSHPTLLLAQQLVNCVSVTPHDGGCQEIISRRLRRQHFVCESFERCGVKTLWAKRGSGAPHVCFVGHTDVVPSGPVAEWQSDPFQATVREGRLYGRGTCDMKTSIAAFVVAIERFFFRYPYAVGTMSVLVTSDEEGDAQDGTRFVANVLKDRRENIDYCLVGEPVCENRLGDTIKNGARGSMNGFLTVYGLQGHISYTAIAAQSAILRLLPVLEKMRQTTWDMGNAFFPPTSWQISTIHAGVGAVNVIPGAVSVTFNFRFCPDTTPESLQERVQLFLREGQCDYDLSWQVNRDTFLTVPGRLTQAAAEAIHEVIGTPPILSTGGATSDGRFMPIIAREIIELGPCRHMAHQINENILLSDIEPLTLIYEKCVERLCQPAPYRTSPYRP